MSESQLVTDAVPQTCAKHGAYTREGFRSNNPRVPTFWMGCPKCGEEREAEIEKQSREREERKQATAERKRIEDAHIPARYSNKTFSDFEAKTANQKKALATVTNYTNDFGKNLEYGRCLVAIGTVGTGKTHLACAMLMQLAKDGFCVRYTTVSGLIRSIRDTWRKDSQHSETAALQCLADVDLLVIDEVGASFGTEAEITQLNDLVDIRYRNMKPIVVITNLDREGLKRALGERAFDRLRENDGVVAVFSGESWRGHHHDPMIEPNAITVQ